MLKKPKQNPINKLPESPRYNFAGGKLYIKKPKITNNNTTDRSLIYSDLGNKLTVLIGSICFQSQLPLSHPYCQ